MGSKSTDKQDRSLYSILHKLQILLFGKGTTFVNLHYVHIVLAKLSVLQLFSSPLKGLMILSFPRASSTGSIGQFKLNINKS